MISKLSIVLLCFLAITVKSAEPELEDGVLVLTDENFDETINKHKHILVEFYAPWCGHCKKLTPEYAAAAQELAAEGIPLAKVDATVHKECSGKFKISGFPTLKFFTNGIDSEYNGGRVKAEIVQWLRKKTGPVSRELLTVDQVESFANSAEAVVVHFGAEGHSTFTGFANAYDDLSFAHCHTDECLAHYKVENGTTVILKKFDEKRNDLAKGYDQPAFASFISSKTVPTIMKFDEKCAQVIFGKANPGLFLYYDKNASNAAELEAVMNEVAPQVKGRIQAVITGITVGLETRLAEYVGVTQADLPSVRIADTRSELKKFTMSGAITAQSVLAFVADWEASKLSPSLKSEEVPATQDGPTYVLVGKEFDRIVMDPTKDVIVKFYAPWCGHCKKIAPIYDEVATKLAHNKNLIIAKMDSTLNETDKVSIQGFPTIKFWPAGDKSAPIDFNGDRTVDGFVDFLTKHSVNKVAEKDDL
jgi:protein disulfide-isomerase A1